MESARSAIKFLLIGSVILSITACQSLRRRTSVTDTTQAGETLPKEGDRRIDPESSLPHRPKLGLILSAGGFKAFAHAGVLKELQAAKIPVDAVVGLEWGALVGALFSQKGLVHEVEWKLYKLEQKSLSSKSLFSGRKTAASVSGLQPFFADNFGSQNVKDGAIRFACFTQSLRSGAIMALNQGTYVELMGRCLAYPPALQPQDYWMAAASPIKEAAEYLRRQGIEIVALVNVMGTGTLVEPSQLKDDYASGILWQEVRRSVEMQRALVDEVIDVDTSRFHVMDFERRKELVRAGEIAGQKAARNLIEKYGY